MGETAASAVNRLAPKIPGDLARGNLTVFLGDSNTQGVDSALTGGQHQLGATCYVQYAALLSNNQIAYLWNAGVGGETSTQILARVSAVIALRPAKVILMVGTNDMAPATGNPGYVADPTGTLATLQANITTIVALLRAAGIDVILCTILPNITTAYRPGIVRANAWIRWFAHRHGLMLLDVFALLTDPENAHSNWRIGYAYQDGVHTAASAAALIGQYAATQLAAYYPNVTPELCHENVGGEGINLLANGIFVGDTNADGVANSWGVTGSGGTVTPSLVDDAAITGNWQRLDVGAAGSRVLSQLGIAPGASTYAIGDVLQLTGRLRTTDVAQADGGTATSATSTTLTDTTKTWALNGWTYVAITGGTGAGQTRIVSGVLTDTLTISAPWGTTPDSSSTYAVTGGMSVNVRLRFTAPGGPYDAAPVQGLRMNVDNKVFQIRQAVPAGTTLVEAQVTNGLGGTGKIDVAQLLLVNLTARGLAA